MSPMLTHDLNCLFPAIFLPRLLKLLVFSKTVNPPYASGQAVGYEITLQTRHARTGGRN